MIEHDGEFEEVGDFLSQLSDEALDREIRQAGFDPRAERAGGPGLRERVVVAISSRRAKDNPPKGA